ncbi:PE-PGRS family protein [Streptomyces bauhiniae]|uniref:PE-PGRS family protein n=1 Tax=Streptomyces bauhiniae TaxID=2340725 RepID=A0A7K3QPD3_9ACTN|nr:PE-PGRS family protein [Streptomyces bauhiniae]NEB91756.1 PE-PGRS family protein [Streptomyces bauhiniae]
MTGDHAELHELLHRAGLEKAGHGRVSAARPSRAAWRPVIAANTKPALAVPDDRPDLVPELNRQWHRLAVEHGVIDGNGEFLINVANHGCACWTRVRLGEQWDLAGLLGPQPGQPEFVTMSPDGESVLGVTCEEYEVWFVAVAPFGDWLEAWAREWAAGRPEGLGAGWDVVLRRKTPSARLRVEWRDGLARNPAASPAVLRRLLDVGPEERLSSWLNWRELPEEMVEAWVAHPEWRVRRELVQPWPLDAEQSAALFRDPDPRHRWALLGCVVDRHPAFTAATFAQLAADPDPRVRAELVRHRDLPVHHLVALAADPDTAVRKEAVPSAWAHLTPPARTALLADPDADVRAEAVLLHHDSTPLTAADFAALPGDAHRERAARACVLARELAVELIHDTETSLRSAAAQNPHLDADLVALLGQDPEPDVRWWVSIRPDLTEAERSRVAIEFDPSARCHPLPWVTDLADDEEAMRRCATSAHVMLRRSAACATNLPPDVVELLAQDEDWVVRLFLAEHCAQAPADLLLEMVRSWNGYSSARMIEHPNFPRQGALRFADDPDPRTRRLALLDPEAPTELVERFSRDADASVRRAALDDERLSVASLVRLLDDPHWFVRDTAAVNPRLPTHVLTTRLYDRATASSAAANPALPEAVMHHLLDATEIDGGSARAALE